VNSCLPTSIFKSLSVTLPPAITPTIGEGLIVAEQKTSGVMDELFGKRRLMVFN
jgi:hypothetical protein